MSESACVGPRPAWGRDRDGYFFANFSRARLGRLFRGLALAFARSAFAGSDFFDVADRPTASRSYSHGPLLGVGHQPLDHPSLERCRVGDAR